MHKTKGIHHITAITADPQKNLDFYEGFLGQRLVKKTVNFDDPNAYHLYYGDSVGTPGTIMTFFYWAGMPRGHAGVGEVTSLAYRIKPSSVEYWKNRAAEHNIELTETTTAFNETALHIADPDGLEIELVVSEETEDIEHWQSDILPAEHALLGFYSATLNVRDHAMLEETLTEGMGYTKTDNVDTYQRYESVSQPGKFLITRECPDLPPARQGAGSIHHIAFQAETDDVRDQLKTQVNDLGISSTGLVDRQYFHATYFMTPANILFEIATNDMGFVIDEDKETLGEALKLPPQYEAYRDRIEPNLEPLSLPRDHAGTS